MENWGLHHPQPLIKSSRPGIGRTQNPKMHEKIDEQEKARNPVQYPGKCPNVWIEPGFLDRAFEYFEQVHDTPPRE